MPVRGAAAALILPVPWLVSRVQESASQPERIPVLMQIILFAALLLAAAWIDYQEHIIPDILSAPLPHPAPPVPSGDCRISLVSLVSDSLRFLSISCLPLLHGYPAHALLLLRILLFLEVGIVQVRFLPGNLPFSRSLRFPGSLFLSRSLLLLHGLSAEKRRKQS